MLKRLVVAEEEALVGGHRLDHVARHRVVAGRAQPFGQRGQVAQLLALQDRREAGLQQIELVGPDHQSGAALQQRREGVEGGGRQCLPHARAVRSSSSSFGAMRGSGRTAWHSPACATAPGMPQTTLVASSWAMALPPASMTRRVPARPS